MLNGYDTTERNHVSDTSSHYDGDQFRITTCSFGFQIMSLSVNNNDSSNEIKLIRCAINDDELIEAFDNYSYDKNYDEKKLVEVALGKFLEEEGYL